MSGVLAKDRKETDVHFLLEILDLIAETNAMLSKRKKDKYYNVYGEYLVEISLRLYENAQLANNVLISKTTPMDDYNRRREYFQRVLADLSTFQSISYVYTSSCIQLKTFNIDKAEKFLNRQGLRIATIRKSIINVMKKDNDKARNLEKERLKKQVYLELNIRKQYYDTIYNQRKENNEVIIPLIFENSNNK
jgi:hypothetical protein